MNAGQELIANGRYTNLVHCHALVGQQILHGHLDYWVTQFLADVEDQGTTDDQSCRTEYSYCLMHTGCLQEKADFFKIRKLH